MTELQHSANIASMDIEPRRYSRSVSQWKGLSKCGMAFKLERLHRKDLPVRPAAWTAGGIAFHSALMTWEAGDREEDFAALFAAEYDDEIQAMRVKQPDLDLWLKPPRTKSVEQDIKNYRERFLTKDVPLYEARCREAEWEILKIDGEPALELEFELDLDGIVVRGGIDRVQWWPNEGYATVEDTKTGSPEGHEHDTRQLGVYKLALEEIFGVNLMYGRYWFTKVDRGSQWFDLDKYTHEYVSEEIRKVDQVIQQGLFLANPGKHCEMCSVKPWCPEKGYLKIGEEM